MQFVEFPFNNESADFLVVENALMALHNKPHILPSCVLHSLAEEFKKFRFVDGFSAFEIYFQMSDWSLRFEPIQDVC